MCFFFTMERTSCYAEELNTELKFSQLTRDFISDGLLRFTYTENRSKNRCGGFNQLDIENKVVEQF